MVIAGPNVSVDRLIGVDRFDPGHIHRAELVQVRIGGGGVNAARVAARLGAAATLVTVLPEKDEADLVERIGGEGVQVKWIRCSGQVRVATVVRERTGRMSVLNEPGAALGAGEWDAFVQLAQADLDDGRVLLCSGSLPPGAPLRAYAEMACDARRLGCPCIIDAAGAALEAVLDARAGLVVPNLAEAEGALHGPRPEPVHPEDAPARASAAAAGLIARGAPAAVVTAGGAGAAYAERGPHGRRGWVAAPAVVPMSPIGAGDAFAAGLALRIEAGAPLDEAVGFAAAVAAAHVESEDGDLCLGRAHAMLRPHGPQAAGGGPKTAHSAPKALEGEGSRR